MVHVEAMPGVVFVMAAWMLDAAACSAMELGAPRVALPALTELHHLLVTLGFRADSQDDSNVAQGEQDELRKTAATINDAPTCHGARPVEASRDDASRTRCRDRAVGRIADGISRNRRNGERQ